MSVESVVALTLLVGTPTAWTPEARPLDARLLQAESPFYELLNTDYYQDPVSFGLVFGGKRRISEATFGFASLGGRVYEPSPTASQLEVLMDGKWRPVEATRRYDYRRVGYLAPVQGRGTAYWSFRFTATDVEGVRLRADASAHRDPGYRCIALASLATNLTDNPLNGPSTLGERPSDTPDWLRRGANLLRPEAGARRGPGGAVTWPRPMMVNAVRFRRPTENPTIRYLTRAGWREVRAESEDLTTYRFAPVATTSLSVSPLPEAITLDDNATNYFDQLRTGRSDLLAARFMASEHRDLAEMASYALPIDFSMGAIGRPADLHETMTLWSGMFLMIDGGAGTYPRDGSPAPPQGLDRWFMPITDGRGWDSDWLRTNSRVVDGGYPAVVTRHERDGVEYEQTLFVTSPDDPYYANVAIVKVTNPSRRRRRTSFGYAMGLRPIWQSHWTPFLQDPWPPKYAVDEEGRTIRNAKGEVVLHSATKGKWGGTEREPHFSIPLDLAPGETNTLAFAFPNVDAPVSNPPDFDADQSWERFRAWWDKTFSASTLSVPEEPLNDIVRNLIAQSLIISLDGDEVKYGAYFYEAYFGIEEGWPAVALAQLGHPKEAKRIAETMLSDVHMDKANHHHQYRNGLAPWYAITVARLLDDRAWLRTLWPKIQASADWTLDVTAKNIDPEFGGILPRHVYGGDISNPARSYYSNATCWRGLHDTAEAAEWLGMPESAARYRAGANAFRQRLLALADRLVDRSNGLPFLPMAFQIGSGDSYKEKEPSYPFLATDALPSHLWAYLGNYWNLFAPMLLEVRLFPAGDSRERWIPEYMQRRGGILAGLVRFHRGYDSVYGKGYVESLLEQGRREEFWTALYGLLGQSISGNFYAMPEVSEVFSLRTDNAAMYREYQRMRWNFFYRFTPDWLEGWQSQEGDPLAAGAGMLLQTIRMALVREDFAHDPPQRLRLLDGVPPAWLAPGKKIAFHNANTFFGPVSLECAGESERIRLSVETRKGVPFTLRLAPPSGRLARVTVDGVAVFPTDGELDLIGTGRQMVVEAKLAGPVQGTRLRPKPN